MITNEHSEQARAPHTNGPRDVPRWGALSLIKKTLRTRFNSKPKGTEANDASRSVRARRGSQNFSGVEVWATAFWGREEERKEGGRGEDGLFLYPLVGMFVIFGPVCPRVWLTRFSGRKSFPRGDARTASITPGLRLKRSARGKENKVVLIIQPFGLWAT